MGQSTQEIKGFFINLEAEAGRRDLFESAVEVAGMADRFERFVALTPGELDFVPDTKMTAAQLGCLMSHHAILDQSRNTSSHIHIAEDDAVFHPQAAKFIRKAITRLDHTLPEWDLLFTDAHFPDLTQLQFRGLKLSKKVCEKEGKIRIINPADYNFAGTASYLVNAKSVTKVADMLEQLKGRQNALLDLFYRIQCAKGNLRAFITFPFLSSIADTAFQSSIAAENGTLFLNDMIRQSFFLGAETQEILARAEELNAEIELDDMDKLYQELSLRRLTLGEQNY